MPEPSTMINLGQLQLRLGKPGELFTLTHSELENPLHVGGPVFEIGGMTVGKFTYVGKLIKEALEYDGQELILRYLCADAPEVELRVQLRSFSTSSILRMKYSLVAQEAVILTKEHGRDAITYLRLEQPGLENCAMTEYQLSHFDPVQHSYMPNREERNSDELFPGLRFAGPLALFHTPGRTLLAAYEHGADHPLSFLDFAIDGELPGQRAVVLQAVRGNYYAGQVIEAGQAWVSAWLELGLYPGGVEAFLPEYRRFFLDEVCENHESRKPYLYYNTWNYQERQKYFHNRPYLESMNAQRILGEIDVANQLGIDVFVVDTGWYKKTGDWLPNQEKFPKGLWEVKRRLGQYGMNLGLWFNPTVAALTSQVYLEHPDWEMEWEGKPRWRGPVWETEESTNLCLASDYADYYIDVMVHLNQDLGVTYFKWDGVSQYGCDSPNHNHGTQANTPEERRDCYAYQMGLAMIHIVEEVTRRCPGVIVDFDITEGGRFVGLGFLAVGKVFLVNNGPYFAEFDIPPSVKIEPDTINVFFYPGAARSRICRQGVKFDELVPSILFLTHYLPDPPKLSQNNSIASLVLGGSGFWGDLLALSEEDIEYMAERIALYKLVGEGVTRAFPHRRGFAGSSPEIHEKISADICSGVVVFFTVTPGTFTHYTQPLELDALGEVAGADECVVV
ncbi:MAG: alpha-galactosidase, partial [Anaerolineaceae bacterium]|nr:alpha-galactosidase [Anaerolineaceae bacterium]